MPSNSYRRRRLKRNFHVRFNLIKVMIIFAFTAFFASIYFFVSDSYGLASKLYNYLNRNTYEIVETETDGIRIIDGDFTIDSPGARLENVHLLGNLYLGENIGDGSVDLINIAVDGLVLVQGGGMKTVNLVDSQLADVRVNRPAGKVRLVASGGTTVSSIILETESRLEEELAEGAEGFVKVKVHTDQKLELNGTFNTLMVAVKDANVELEGDFIDEIIIARTASGSVLKASSSNLFINNLYLKANAYIIGPGNVDQAFLAAGGINKLSGTYNNVTITAEAGRFELLEESVFAEIVVENEAFNNQINLHDNVTVAFLELNEAVNVTGFGKINKVLINAAGSSFEQIPQDIEFAINTPVMVAGFEITSMEMLYSFLEQGDSYEERNYNFGREDTQVLASDQQNNNIKEDQSESGQETKPKREEKSDQEPDNEPVPDPEAEPENTDCYNDGNKSESSSENGTDLIKYFETRRGITPGKKLVVVILNLTDQTNYKVLVGDYELEYRDVLGGFRGEVPEPDALLEKVVIKAR